MGKGQPHNLHHPQQSPHTQTATHTPFFCERCCPMIRLLRILELEFSFRCFFVLLLSLCLLVSAIFWIFPFHKLNLNGFDAKDEIKLSATVQAYFRIQKPAWQLVPHIDRLEFEIFEEIGVPATKAAILSMHQSDTSNGTDVVFGILSEPINKTINTVSLSVLRSSLIELFFQQSNLTLTASVFGQPSMFEILKFPGGITIMPLQYNSIWQMPQILFNFTLNNSISEILDNFGQLKDQLEFGLQLHPYEYVFVQLTNSGGSTIEPPVTVQASVISAIGIIMPQRLKQLAGAITDSPGRNLGLDNSVFGKVKGVSLSSYLSGTLHAITPTPSPAPSPDPTNPSSSPYLASPPPLPPSPPSTDYGNRCRTGPKFGPARYSPPVNSPEPSIVAAEPPTNLPSYLPPVGSPSHLPPELSPLPGVSYDSNPDKNSESSSLAPSPLQPFSSSVAVGCFYREIWLSGFCGVLVFHLFGWAL